MSVETNQKLTKNNMFTSNCKICGEIKEHMVAYIPHKYGNTTGMICSDCKNNDSKKPE